MTADPQPGPLVVGGVVVLHGPWLDVVADLLDFQASRLWREARLRPSRRQLQLLDTVRQALSAVSATSVREDIIGAPTGDHEFMNIKELAAELGCSVRHARRTADRLDPRFDGRCKLVSRQAVHEHLEGLNAAC